MTEQMSVLHKQLVEGRAGQGRTGQGKEEQSAVIAVIVSLHYIAIFDMVKYNRTSVN